MLSTAGHRAFAVLALLCVLAACGGGGGGGVTPPTAAPQATPSSSVPTPQALATISSSGNSAALSVTASMTVTASADSGAPSGTSPLLRRRNTTATGTPLFYFTISSASQSEFFLIALNATFTLASAPATPVYLGYWNNTEWDNVTDTAASVNGTSVTVSDPSLNIAAPSGSLHLVLYSGTVLPTASPSASPTTSPTTSASSSASPTTSPTSSAAPAVNSACLQTPDPATTPGISNVGGSFFSSIVPNGHTICLSAWDLSGAIDTALETAAHNGANVVVITPWSEKSSNASDVAAIISAGGKAVYEYTGATPTPAASPTPPGNSTTAYQQAPMDIHAKFALVDGRAYADGHNWLTSPVQDVVMADGNDFAAIQTVLSNLSTTPSNGTFTTDKQLSLQNESAYLQTLLLTNGITTGNEYDFITESFSTVQVSGEYNDDVYDGMCAIAQTGATMHLVVEEFSGYSASAKAALQNLELIDINASVRTDDNGHEKISMYRSTVGGTPSSAWFGSSNSTSTDLFDWGLDTSDSGMLAALQSYFDSEYNSQATAIPTASPGVMPSPCSSPHP